MICKYCGLYEQKHLCEIANRIVDPNDNDNNYHPHHDDTGMITGAIVGGIEGGIGGALVGGLIGGLLDD